MDVRLDTRTILRENVRETTEHCMFVSRPGGELETDKTGMQLMSRLRVIYIASIVVYRFFSGTSLIFGRDHAGREGWSKQKRRSTHGLCQ